MKTFVKTSIIGALALAMVTFGTSNAQARGWSIAAGIVGGVAIGATVVAANTHVYAYPAYPYAAYPAYAPAPTVAYYAPATVAPAQVYVQSPAPVVVAAPYPYVYSYGRVGWGRGHGWIHGHDEFRR